jgi:uncharacterized membrane protein
MGTAATNFLKATIVGGLLFLLPVVLILIFLRRALQPAGKVAEPLSCSAGLAPWRLPAVLVLVLISFLAGLVARTRAGRRTMRLVENSLLGGIPQYQLVKGMAEGLAQVENAEGVKPALVSIEDGWQIGYLLEPLENGWVTVFLPQAPTPMSGTVMYLPADRVRPLDIPMVKAVSIVKHIGVGSGAALQGVDLTLPVSA